MVTIRQSEGAQVRVYTFKEGLLSAVAHDLEIAVERFSITWDEARTKVSATFDTSSLRVLTPMSHGRPNPGALSDRDLRKIEANIASDVLHVRSHPEARFESSSVTPDGDGLVVRGTLTLAGRANDITATVRKDGSQWTTEVALDQPRWGITPYSAMMGTLKIKPEVRVRISVPG